MGPTQQTRLSILAWSGSSDLPIVGAMRIALIVFDGFTDIDLYLPWDLLHRPQQATWEVPLPNTCRPRGSRCVRTA